MFGKAVTVGEIRVLFLQEGRIRKQDAAKILRAGCANHLAPEPVAYQQRQIARMIDMGMGQNDEVDGLRV